MKISEASLKKGQVFDQAPARILFGSSEDERRDYFQKQFELLIKHWHEIPWRQWGVGSAKTFSDLLREIGAGETSLIEEDGQLVRSVEIVIVFVLYKNKWLVEGPQQMVDGRSRIRRFPYISEKLILGEHPSEAAIRALRQESGGYIKGEPERLTCGERVLLDENHPYNTGSSTYPGLKSKKMANTFSYLLKKDEYKQKYLEIDASGALVTHSWQPMGENFWFSGRLLETLKQ